MKTPRLVTYKQAAEIFGATAWYWKTRVWKQELQNAGTPGKHLLDTRDIEAWLNNNKTLS